jgi:hypothetical protein
MWEKVRNSCGTKQADLLDERRSQVYIPSMTPRNHAK